MVRVISVHHFDNQVIQTTEEPVAVVVASHDRLLFALPHHVIEVRSLQSNGEVQYSFPTVDKVTFISYCSTGNYVTTLETKHSRNSREAVYARVYTNWDKKGSSDDDQPMRARIAGRVTPSSSQTSGETLEMIELPVKFAVISCITCCQETGNILVACEKVLCLFQLVTRTHDISRHRFLDFEQWPVTLELSFSPTQLSMVEDVVAAQDSLCLHVFRINKGFARASDWSSSSSHSGSPHSTKSKTNKKDDSKSKEKRSDKQMPIDLDELLREVSDGRSTPKQRLLLGNGPLPVIAMLPSIKCSLANNPARNLRVSPFKPPHSVTMGVAIKEIPANEPWTEKMTTMVESLLQLELGFGSEDDPREEFTCLALRPLYKIASTRSPAHTETSCPRLRSQSYCNLVAFNCLICTQQEGYMYHFPVEDGEVMSLGRCISVYSFTSQVKFVCLEPYLVHALTTTGLETYTMRAIHAIHSENSDEVCPPADEPVCLVGLRPFLGVTNMNLSESYIIILSSSNDSSPQDDVSRQSTIYGLRLPSVGSLYTDILAMATSHKFSSPTTYYHLLTEAHVVLRSVVHVSTDPHHIPAPFEKELYQESCSLLSDYCLSSENEDDWEAGYQYSLMAKLNATQVMERLKKLESEAKELKVNLITVSGLTHFLKKCLTACGDDSSLPIGALNTLLDLVELKHGPFLLSSLVLQSPVLKQFSTERTIRIISNHIKNCNEEVDTVDCLALTLLYVSREKTKEAAETLKLLPYLKPFNEDLVDVLLNYWPLLLDNTRQMDKPCKWEWEGVTLSELAVLFMEERPKELATALSSLVTHHHTLQLHNVLQVFLTYLPSRMGSAGSIVGHVLQMFLEGVFIGWQLEEISWKPDASDASSNEALKMLMRSYLSDLVTKNERDVIVNCSPGVMFGVKRPSFLELLPPFSDPDCQSDSHASLLKLQCLLITGWLDECALSELVQFVSEFVPQPLALGLLVLSQPPKAVELLAQYCPSALPQYAKDVLKCEPEWTHLISTIQSKADEDGEKNKEGNNIYSQVLEEILENLARTLSCDVFSRVVPPGDEFKGYIVTCQQVAHASHIRSVIMATGSKLTATLNL